MNLTYFGHSAFMIETKGFKLLFDPFISQNELASKIDISQLMPDYILLSHGHGDHIADAEQIARQSNALLISSYEVINWFLEKKLKGHHLNHGGVVKFDFGMLKYVNAVHSSVMPDGTYGGNPGGFVIWNEEGCFYFSGDTALTLDMQLIPMTCPKLDFAILCIGNNFTMGVDDAVIAADFVQCDKIVGAHYDTFEPIKINKSQAKQAFQKANKTLFLPAIGETIKL
jgi:L-ascorbate metabolism protein UlaG (beta-lactamase superfamily)